jgi:hypothetical protein
MRIQQLNTKVEKEKESFDYGKGTRLEIDKAKTLLELSKGPLDTYADKLANSALNAEQLAKFLADALKSQLALNSAKQTISGSQVLTGIQDGTITKSNITLDQALAGAKQATKNINDFLAKNTTPQRKMFGGAILSKGRGGMGAVKSMAFGGRAIGSDSVPAMLTPGEFVMNKAASKAYGPLLERINESKYPGMLSGGGMTQIPVTNISTSMNDNSTAVYNYNLGFSINGANGSAKDIANAVMREIKNVDSQRIRGQRR